MPKRQIDPKLQPFGSDALKLTEKRLNRFFTREYQEQLVNPEKLSDKLIQIASHGPMWETTSHLMAQHYDASEAFFRSFLDSEFLAYSMAFYSEIGATAATIEISLEEAQRNKFKTICKRAGLQGDEQILNIGCGFGSFERYLIENYPQLQITSITASTTQSSYINEARDNPAHPLSSKRFKLITGDFADLTEKMLGIESFDMVFSIGVLEHARNLAELFKKIAILTKPGGYAFHHLIVSRIPIPRFLNPEKTLIGDYFPGGRIWPYDLIAKQESGFSLEQGWFVNGMNYWRTLDQWHERFWNNMDNVSQDELSTDDIQYWNDYFSLCKACFAPMEGEVFGNGQFLFRKT